MLSISLISSHGHHILLSFDGLELKDRFNIIASGALVHGQCAINALRLSPFSGGMFVRLFKNFQG
jgi:hypothetical protein